MPEVTAPTAADPKATAGNIAKGIDNKVNGVQSAPDKNTPAPVQVDPNVGKEKIVVEGKEVWVTPEQLRALAQKGMAYEPKVTQLGLLKNESAAFLEGLIKNPLAVLTNLAKQRNIPIEQIYEKVLDGDWPDAVKEIVGKRYYGNVVEPLKLSPEELKAREDAKWRTKREQEDAVAKDNMIKEDNRRKVEMAFGQLKAQIGEAMKESGLPNNDTPLAVAMARRVADKMRLAYFQKQTLTPKAAIEMVKKELKEVQTHYYDSLDEENLVREIGPVNAEKVKKYFLKLVKEAERTPTISSVKPTGKKGERKTINSDEFREMLSNFKK